MKRGVITWFKLFFFKIFGRNFCISNIPDRKGICGGITHASIPITKITNSKKINKKRK